MDKVEAFAVTKSGMPLPSVVVVSRLWFVTRAQVECSTPVFPSKTERTDGWTGREFGVDMVLLERDINGCWVDRWQYFLFALCSDVSLCRERYSLRIFYTPKLCRCLVGCIGLFDFRSHRCFESWRMQSRRMKSALVIQYNNIMIIIICMMCTI